ncbi:hypothetical protein [Deinococcus hohokamensis]|uniref:HAD superfamily Cof-like phosphohydrolase n=1 Tax=Deinococcus hohokamensis TaxID=309883 RepID=A0ABV9IC15_9DEIO
MPERAAPLTNAQRLRAFHDALGMKQPERPGVPSRATLTLRRTLIEEESHEVLEAFAALARQLDAGQAPGLAELAALAHELADLLYVTYGAFDALGIDADAVFAEIHRANLAKAGGPRRGDGKLLKPEGWLPADVRAVLERRGE